MTNESAPAAPEALALADGKTLELDGLRWRLMWDGTLIRWLSSHEEEFVNAALRTLQQQNEELRTKLDAIQNGDSTLLTGIVPAKGSLDIGLQSPLVPVMADALANMIGDNNYVEMRMTHKQTGEEFIISCQRCSRPTPHDKRLQAEQRADELQRRLEQESEQHDANMRIQIEARQELERRLEAREPCPLCKGTGKVLVNSFQDNTKQIESSCHICKGSGSLPSPAGEAREGWVSVSRSLAERTEAMFRSVDSDGQIAQEWKEALSALPEEPK